MYQGFLESSLINDNVNTIFILTVKLKSGSDALNKRTEGPGSEFFVWWFLCNDSMCLAVRKRFLRLMVM